MRDIEGPAGSPEGAGKAGSGEAVIRVRNLSKCYRLYDRNVDRLKEALHPLQRKYHTEFYALNGVSFEVRRGEILGIVGPNGAGKSTLLKVIAGVAPLTSGECDVEGKVSSMLELSSGLNPELTGVENIYLSGTIAGFTRKETEERVDDILAFADIGKFATQPLKFYSSGMKARLGFAVASHIRPEILILDEVLAVGDSLFKRKCYGKMRQLFASGCTVLFVSHSAGSINEICTRAILLDGGELLLDGPPVMVTRYYHKLQYARPNQRRRLREEILSFGEEEKGRYGGQAKDRAPEGEGEAGPPQEDGSASPVREAYYIPDLQPPSTTRHEYFDIRISDAAVTTPEGRQVNALVLNHEYRLRFKVRFGIDVDDARFNVLAQNEKGLSLSGFAFPGRDEKGLKAKRGEVYEGRMTFRASFLPGTYYFGVAVVRIDERHEKVVLSGVNDIIAVKVLKPPGLRHWGLFDMGQRGTVGKASPPDGDPAPSGPVD